MKKIGGIFDSEEDDKKFVAEKYKDYMNKNGGEMPEMFNPYNKQKIDEIAPTQTANCGGTTNSSTVLIKEEIDGGNDLEEIAKRKLCNELIEKGICKPYDIIKHSYTTQIENGNKKCVERNDGIMVTLTTRPDTVGVCVDDNDISPLLVGGIGEKTSNNGTQYFEQRRIYSSLKTATCIPAESSFHPFYLVKEDE